jgi:hypothetical protein
VEPRERDGGFGYDFCRYAAAALLLLYGFAKLTGAQFTVLDSELDKPLREVSGFWLTWYYFGYSQAYGTIVALVQIAGAIALLFPRTALLGVCVLLPVVGNIILIDVFYGVECGALGAALFIAGCLARVVARDRERLAALLLPGGNRRQNAIAAGAAVLLSGAALAFTYYLANFNNRIPTRVDGTWAVVTPHGPDAPTHVYFERNRAWMCVFRYRKGTSEHHFEVAEDARTVRIWTFWRSKGPLLLRGQYDAARTRMTLSGRLPGSARPASLVLVKVRGQ